MEDVNKENTDAIIENKLRKSIIFFNNEEKAATINIKMQYGDKVRIEQAIVRYKKLLEGISGVGGIINMYREFQKNKNITIANKLIIEITQLKLLLDSGPYEATNLITKGKQFEDMVTKYLEIDIKKVLNSKKDFDDNVNTITEKIIEEVYDDDGTKMKLTEFQSKFRENRQNYISKKDTYYIIKELNDALNYIEEIANNIINNVKTNREKKNAAEKIISELNKNIINVELVQIENAVQNAKTNIHDIEGLEKKESYNTRIDKIKNLGLKSYFERKIKEISKNAIDEITKKEKIKEIVEVANKANNELQEITTQNGNEATIQTIITEAITAIEESKKNKIQEINTKGNAFLYAHIDEKIKEILNDVTKKFPTASQEEIGNLANDAKKQLEALKMANGLSHEIKDKLKDKLKEPIEIPQEIITTINKKIQEIEKLEKGALIKKIVEIANNNIDNETTIDGVNTIVMDVTEKLQKLITQDGDDSIKGSIEKAIEELNKNKGAKIELLKQKVDEDTSKEANNIIETFSSSLYQKNHEEIRAIAQTNITKIQEIQGLTDEKKEDDLKKIKLLEIKAHSNYFEGEITNKGKINEIEDAYTKATKELQELLKQTGDDAIIQKITEAIAAIKESKDNKKEEIDKEGEKLLHDRIKSEIVKISTEVTDQFRNASSPKKINDIANEAISKLQALKKADGLSDIKEKLIDSTTIPEEINTIIENKITEIQELEKKKLTQHANEKIEEKIKNLIATGKGILQGQDKDNKGYKKSETINDIKIALETDLNKINDETFKQITQAKYEKQLEDLEKEIMKESKDALIKKARDVIEKARQDEQLKATKLKKEKEKEIKEAQDKLQELVQKLGEKAHLHMTLTKNIEKKEEEKKDKEEEKSRANAELSTAALEFKKAQDASDEVEAPIKAEAEAKAKAKAEAKAEAEAKAKAEAEEQVNKYKLARDAHGDETDENKLIKASSDYDKFITDINERLDHIIFLCNQFDFERINMLLKKLIVNHDYVAKDINPNARKYSDLNSIKKLNEKMLTKGEYTRMIDSMNKKINLINNEFNEFLLEYKNIQYFHEESMSEDIQDINSKIVKILYKLKKLRHDNGKEQDTLPLDFALIADNAIIYKMNSYNFFKKIIKNLHIIQDSTLGNANFEEFIAEQRQIFNSKFYTMYENLYSDFQTQLHASLDKIDIIKGRSKNNLSAIIKKLETPVIDDPENIAKAMSYAYDLNIPIPDDEVVIPDVKDANITSILARVKSAQDELNTKTETVSRLNDELSIIDANLLTLQDENALNEKEREKIEKEKNEIEKDIQLKEESLKAQTTSEIGDEDKIDIDEILKDKAMALMGIKDTKEEEKIKLQKEWINSIKDIEIKDDKDKETFAYIMKAVNNTNAGESPSEANQPVQRDLVANRSPSGETPQLGDGEVKQPPVYSFAEKDKQEKIGEEQIRGKSEVKIIAATPIYEMKTENINYNDIKFDCTYGDNIKCMASLNAGDTRLYIGGGTINEAFGEQISKAYEGTTTKTLYELSINLHYYFYYTLYKQLEENEKDNELIKRVDTYQYKIVGPKCYSNDDESEMKKNEDISKIIETFNNTKSSKILGILHTFDKKKFTDFEGYPWFEEIYLYIPQNVNRLDRYFLIKNHCRRGVQNPSGNMFFLPGDVFIEIFNKKFPRNNDQNKAMIYCVGPDASSATYDVKIFYDAIKKIGINIASAIKLYNEEKDGTLKIDYVRICLMCGQGYKHPKANVSDIAKNLVRGILTIDNSGVEYNFAYVQNPDNENDTEGVFEKAYNEINNPI